MENEETHLPLITLTSEKGPEAPGENKVSDAVNKVAGELMAQHRRREALEAEARKDPMFNLKVALLRGDPNRSRSPWTLTRKKKHW